VLYRYAVVRKAQLSASQWQMLMQGMLLQSSYSDVLELQHAATATSTADATTSSAIAAATDSVSGDVLRAYSVAAELLSLDTQAVAPAAAPAAVADSTGSSETVATETAGGETAAAETAGSETAATETVETEAVVTETAVTVNKYDDAVYTNSFITLVRSLGPATPDVKVCSTVIAYIS
jgi:hypothetical protein